MRRVQSGVSSSGWHSPRGIITWGHTEFPVPSFIPGHDPRDTGMASGCPERCLGLCGSCHGALPLPPGTRWAPCDPPACPPGSPAAWHKPGQLHIPGARFSSAGGIRGSSRGLSPPGSLRRARLGDHAAGTCSRRYRERGENTTAVLPRSSCCRWGVGAVSPRVPARLSLDASFVFAEPSPSSLLRQLPALPPARPWRKLGKKRFHSAQLRQPGSDHVRHSAWQRSRPSFSPAWPPGTGSASAGGSGRRPGRDVGWHT